MNEQAIKIIDKETGQTKELRFAGDDPRIINQQYLYAIVEGKVKDHEPWTKTGYSPASTSSETTVWGPGTQYVWPSSAIQMEVVSSDNTQDKAGGTGALSVIIYYLDSNFDEYKEVVDLNGTTPVLTKATNIYRVNYFRVVKTGTGAKPVGNISLKAVAPTATIYGYILAGYNRARAMIYTVPRGKRLYVSSVSFSAAATVANKNVRMTTHANYDFLTKKLTRDYGNFFIGYSEIELSDAGYNKMLEIPTMLPAKTDIKVSVVGTAGAVTTCALRGWLENE
ncbi:MAG: hypothetical protein PHE51_04910 [Eubacteriales bacterium]|nr:hypothetical protein [Eubacteriales bacterium]